MESTEVFRNPSLFSHEKIAHTSSATLPTICRSRYYSTKHPKDGYPRHVFWWGDRSRLLVLESGHIQFDQYCKNQYHKDYSRKCWKNINHVVSDQTGLCCLNVFKDRCDGGWAIERRSCISLLLSQTLLFYCGILVTLIATCNCCVFVYILLTKSKDAMVDLQSCLGKLFHCSSNIHFYQLARRTWY